MSVVDLAADLELVRDLELIAAWGVVVVLTAATVYATRGVSWAITRLHPGRITDRPGDHVVATVICTCAEGRRLGPRRDVDLVVVGPGPELAARPGDLPCGCTRVVHGSAILIDVRTPDDTLTEVPW
jgi:hypothetical protein